MRDSVATTLRQAKPLNLMMKASKLIALCVPVLLTASMLPAQAPPSKVPPADSLTRALQLARAHQYSEADAAIRGVAPPADRQQRIAYFRLKAAIASGLGRTNDAAGFLEAARKLAPENLDLQITSGIALLQAQL